MVVDKPAGWTSHGVVARARRLLGTRKVGHAGTLDPMATGVLLVGVGRATRLLGHLALTRKSYTATVRLGVGTLTDDAEGEVTSTPGLPTVTNAALGAAVAALTGEIDQVPTAVSAVKVAGVRAYARVRAGEQVELAARRVVVDRFAVLQRRPVEVDGVSCLDLDVEVDCSSGTYVRALARDLGAALGSAGHLTALRRTAVGPFTLAEAVPLDAATATLPLLGLDEVAARCFPSAPLRPEQVADVRHGRRLPDLTLAAVTALTTPGGEFLALYRPVGADAVPVAVFG